MEFTAVPSVSPEDCARYTAHTRSLGLPSVQRAGHVAVVGGGPSVIDHLDELRAWNGPVWAINETYMWLRRQGVEATFFTADPKFQPWLKMGPGERALVALHSSPELLASIAGADIQTYELAQDAVHCGPTTATAAPCLAVWMGHRSVTLFGCDSSFNTNAYAYGRDLPDGMIIVLCDGERYLTKPEFLMQADDLAALCRETAVYCKSRSGGLLEALIKCPEREVLGFVPDSFAREYSEKAA